jgi:predicted transcriptional regulator of viral defense system
MGRKKPQAVPDWDLLYESASAQEGYFTTAQAIKTGYSSQLLHHYVKIHRVERVRRGIYRLVHYPPAENEHLVVLWLWSESAGIFSHETALGLHGLSDALPARVHLTLPLSWKKRRLRLPEGLSVHFDEVPKESQAWHGSIPITAAAQTVIDCAAAKVPSDLVRQAIEQGLSRGLFTKKMVKDAIAYAQPREHRRRGRR